MKATLVATSEGSATALLIARCRDELEHYTSGHANDGSHGLDLVRRAVIDRDDDAWAALCSLYSGHVSAWCRRAGADEAELDEHIADAWTKFWRHFTPEKLRAATRLAEVLTYLKLCATSTVIDAARRRRPALPLNDGILLVDDGTSPEDAWGASEASVALWHLVAAHLFDERDVVLVELTYGLGLRPAEVRACRPDLFPSVHDVYRVTRNILDRLRRNPVIRAWAEERYRAAGSGRRRRAAGLPVRA